MKIIVGQDMGLALVGRVGDASTRKAKPIFWHSHNFFELLFVIEGAITYEFTDHSPLHITGGSFLIIPPGIRHRGQGNIRTPVKLFGVTCKSETSQTETLTPLTAQDITDTRQLFLDNSLSVRECGRELRTSVTRLSQLVKRHSGRDLPALVQARLRAASCTLLIEAAIQLHSRPETDSNAIVTAATAYLEQHCADQLQISDLVHHLGYSRARIFEMFKAGTGMTPNDYLLRCRIRKARELLTDTDQPITEIALDAGFTSSQYFSQVFKKYTGMTPSRYRSKTSPVVSGDRF